MDTLDSSLLQKMSSKYVTCSNRERESRPDLVQRVFFLQLPTTNAYLVLHLEVGVWHTLTAATFIPRL